jgi:hypothetical protein
MHDGQHAAIIAPDRWDYIQQVMQDGAAKGRGSAGVLCLKPLDQKSGEVQKDGWRLPAQQLEIKVAHVVR